MSFLSTNAYLNRPRPDHAWLIQDIIPTGGFAVLYATAKTGKSFLALDIIEAISNPDKSHLFSFPVLQHGPVLYLQIDMAPFAWAERVGRLRRDGLHTFGAVYWADRATEGIPFPFNILGEGKSWLKKHVDHIKPILVVIDTIRDCHGGDENDAGVMSAVIAAIRAACGNAAILMIAHPRKGQKGDMGDDVVAGLRGSTVVVGSADVIMALSKKKLTMTGRAIEETAIPLQRIPKGEPGSGCWTLDQEEVRLLEAMKGVLRDLPQASGVEQGKELAKRMGTYNGKELTPEAARKHITRKGELVQLASLDG